MPAIAAAGSMPCRWAVLAGRIRRDAAGLIDSEAADRAWKANTRETMLGPKSLRQANEQVASPIEAVPGMAYGQARAIREVYDAQRRNLELKALRGELISRQEVEASSFSRFQMLRDACLSLPARLAPQLAAETDEVTVRELFEAELHRIFADSAERRLEMNVPTAVRGARLTADR